MNTVDEAVQADIERAVLLTLTHVQDCPHCHPLNLHSSRPPISDMCSVGSDLREQLIVALERANERLHRGR